MKVTIVGAGIMGLCSAWALIRAGHDVTVLERGPVPNPLGSSVDQHRMTRLLYGDLPGYGAMVDEAMAAYDRLWGDLGRSFYVQTGVLGLSARPGDWTDLSRLQLERQQRPFEVLRPAEIHRRFPFLAAPGIDYGILTRAGGMLLAEPIVAALARHLHGCVQAGRKVVAIDAQQASVCVDDGAVIAADRLLICAGPWIGRLLPEFAERVISHRQVAVYLEPPADLRAAWASAPCVVDFGGDDVLYAFPCAAGTSLKLGCGRYARPGPPDLGREVGPDEPPEIAERFRPHLAQLDQYRIIGARSCCYSMTRDHRFIIEPAGARTLALSCCSGHGFKFAAAIGLRVAAALAGELDLDDLSRWAAGHDLGC